MRHPTSPLVVALTLVTVGSIGWAWWQTAALARTRAELAAAEATVSDLRRQNAPAQTTPAPTPGPRSSPGRTAEAPRPTGPGEEGPPPFLARRASFMAGLLNDPEIAPLLASQRRRAIETRYAALFTQLGLPPDQLEKLKNLLADKQLSRTEAQALARSQGLGRGEQRGLTTQADAEANTQIAGLLGDARFAQLQNYDRTYAQRTTVNDLALRLGMSGTPLPSAQGEQLVQILAANAAPTPADQPAPGDFGPPGPGGRGGFDPTAVGIFFGRDTTDAAVQAALADKATRDATALQQAAAILTPAQLDSLRQMQQEQTDQIRLAALTRARMRQNFVGRGGGPPGG